MEPEIKFENCDNNYFENSELLLPTLSLNYSNMMQMQQQRQAATKRIYSELNVDNPQNEGRGNFGSSHQNAAENLQNKLNIQEQYRNYYTQHFQQQQEMQSFKRFKEYHKKSVGNLLFTEPFFELMGVYDSQTDSGHLTARCLTCQKVLQGHKNVSSNFLKHLKRIHPEVFKIYENVKVSRQAIQKGFPSSTEVMGAPNESMHDEASILNEATTSGEDFDASTFLEQVRQAKSPPTATPGHHQTDEEQRSESIVSDSPRDSERSSANAFERQLPQLHRLGLAPCSNQQHNHQDFQKDKRKSSNPSSSVNPTEKIAEVVNKLLEDKLGNLATRNQVEELKTLLQRAHNNFESSKASATVIIPKEEKISQTETPPSANAVVQSQLDMLKMEFQQLKESFQRSEQSKRQLQKELQAMDKMMYRHRFIIRNIKLDEGKDLQNPEEAVQKLLKDKLDLSQVATKSVINISKNKSTEEKQNLLVELRDAADARLIFKNVTKLKDSGIFIDPDLSHYARKRREKLLVLRKELLRRRGNNDLKVMVRSSRLIVQGKRFYWDEIEGLCVDDTENTPGSSALDTLKALSGEDMTEFLNVLRNYQVR